MPCAVYGTNVWLVIAAFHAFAASQYDPAIEDLISFPDWFELATSIIISVMTLIAALSGIGNVMSTFWICLLHGMIVKTTCGYPNQYCDEPSTT